MTIPGDLLNDLRSSPTDLARIVEAVVRDRLPYVKIPVQTVRSWERRAPDRLGQGRELAGSAKRGRGPRVSLDAIAVEHIAHARADDPM